MKSSETSGVDLCAVPGSGAGLCSGIYRFIDRTHRYIPIYIQRPTLILLGQSYVGVAMSDRWVNQQGSERERVSGCLAQPWAALIGGFEEAQKCLEAVPFKTNGPAGLKKWMFFFFNT